MQLSDMQRQLIFSLVHGSGIVTFWMGLYGALYAQSWVIAAGDVCCFGFVVWWLQWQGYKFPFVTG